jgi:hypothetical protein
VGSAARAVNVVPIPVCLNCASRWDIDNDYCSLSIFCFLLVYDYWLIGVLSVCAYGSNFFLHACFLPLQEDEASKLSKLMMSKKTKRLYGRMQHGIEEKKAAVSNLEAKRAAQEKQDKKASSSAAAKKPAGKSSRK